MKIKNQILALVLLSSVSSACAAKEQASLQQDSDRGTLAVPPPPKAQSGSESFIGAPQAQIVSRLGPPSSVMDFGINSRRMIYYTSHCEIVFDLSGDMGKPATVTSGAALERGTLYLTDFATCIDYLVAHHRR